MCDTTSSVTLLKLTPLIWMRQRCAANSEIPQYGLAAPRCPIKILWVNILLMISWNCMDLRHRGAASKIREVNFGHCNFMLNFVPFGQPLLRVMTFVIRPTLISDKRMLNLVELPLFLYNLQRCLPTLWCSHHQSQSHRHWYKICRQMAPGFPHLMAKLFLPMGWLIVSMSFRPVTISGLLRILWTFARGR